MQKRFSVRYPGNLSGSVDFVPDVVTIWNYAPAILWLTLGSSIWPDTPQIADYLVPPLSTLTIAQPPPVFAANFAPASGVSVPGLDSRADIIFTAGAASSLEIGSLPSAPAASGASGTTFTTAVTVGQQKTAYGDATFFGNFTASNVSAAEYFAWLIPVQPPPLAQGSVSVTLSNGTFACGFTPQSLMAYTIQVIGGFVPAPNPGGTGNIAPTLHSPSLGGYNINTTNPFFSGSLVLATINIPQPSTTGNTVWVSAQLAPFTWPNGATGFAALGFSFVGATTPYSANIGPVSITGTLQMAGALS